jgi:hypothetical protein
MHMAILNDHESSDAAAATGVSLMLCEKCASAYTCGHHRQNRKARDTMLRKTGVTCLHHC